jgi:hypothetical protein
MNGECIVNLPEMEQGLTEHDVPDVVVHAVSENFLVVEIGQQKMNLSKLSAMILMKQLSHALSRNAAPRRSWFWKLCMKRLVKRKDEITERIAVIRKTLQDGATVYDWKGERRVLGAELVAMECRSAVVMREIRNMEME